MNEQTEVGSETAQGKDVCKFMGISAGDAPEQELKGLPQQIKQKASLGWQKTGEVAYLPGLEFAPVLNAIRLSEEFEKRTDVEVEDWVCDKDGEFEFIALSYWDKCPGYTRREWHFFWFNKAADRFELVDDPALWQILWDGFRGEDSGHDWLANKTNPDSIGMRFARRLFRRIKGII